MLLGSTTGASMLCLKAAIWSWCRDSIVKAKRNCVGGEEGSQWLKGKGMWEAGRGECDRGVYFEGKGV